MIQKLKNEKALFKFYNSLKSDIPYCFDVDYDNWYTSMFQDTDYDNEPLFHNVHTYVSVDKNKITGFIQFGLPTFIHGENGARDTETTAGIIRNLYFQQGDEQAGRELIRQALAFFETNRTQRIFAFYHYFGMTCNAGHGKLHSSHFYIETLLSEYGFIKEHENVYYKRLISNAESLCDNTVELKYSAVNTKGLCLFDIIAQSKKVGAGSFVFLPQGKICYLKWIYIEDEFKKKGYAIAALQHLFSDLKRQGIERIDTDTADGNIAAQGLYCKAGFANMGRTRSYEMRSEKNSGLLESMASFFTSRVDGYDEHMLTNCEGCCDGYIKMAALVPKNTKALLDLGCGTGLELDEIFKVLPDISVTGIDLTQAMLDKLREKHPTKKLNLICGSYFDVEFEKDKYDCAVSFETMHHFSHKMKTELYKRIYKSLNTDGIYIECDYMVENQSEEDFYYSELERLRKEQNISKNEFYHYDTPCTIDNQIAILKEAGFVKIAQVYRQGNTTILTATR